MKELELPYGKQRIRIRVPEDNLAAVLEGRAQRARGNQEELIEGALQEPIASSSLSEQARGRERILIITSDVTRPVPSRLTLPPLIREIKKGSPRARLTLLVGGGLHRKPTDEELREKLGEQLPDGVEVELHDATDGGSLRHLGRLKSGLELWVNRLLTEADLIVAESFIEPHFFAGFTGGRKSVLPAVSGYESIMQNHSPERIDHPRARAGILTGNPIHGEMVEAAGKVPLRFILNVVLDGERRVIGAFAGDPIKAHEEGCRFSGSLARVKAVPGDIVLTSNSGFPLDRNLYQVVKGLDSAEATASPGAVIILAARCEDGVGHEGFFRMMADSASPQEVLQKIREGKIWEEDMWQAQALARILSRHKAIIVTEGVEPERIREMHMEWAPSLEDALEVAFREKGSRARVTVLPEGPALIPEV